MSVDKAGFAERVFEFAFNAEYCTLNQAVLAACPYLPTQQQEKRLGYDVAIKVAERGGAVSSLFLQHKVSRYVSSRTGSNAHFFDATGGPYFAFGLDNNQYNLIHHSAMTNRQAFYFCAPAFTTRQQMDEKFFAQTVVADSIWIDVAGSGQIAAGDTSSHSLIYNSDGSQVWRFSESPQRAKSSLPGNGKELAKPIPSLDQETLANTYESLFLDLREWWPERQRGRRKSDVAELRGMPETLPTHRAVESIDTGIEAVRELAVDYFGVSWLVGVQQ